MQNVDINKEVQRAMMSPPQQPRGIIDLLASELKAQDAQAKNKIRAMMAGSPPQDTVLAQNEKTAEDSVRQEVAQKMQAMAVKERQNQARMNRALRGIAAQSAPNMRMMDGGIVGYQAGGDVQTPPKPTMGAVPPSAVGNEQIKQFAKEYAGIKKALEDPQQAEFKERNQRLLQDLIRQMGDQMPAVMQYIDSMKGMVEPRGFQDGGGVTSNLVDAALSYLAEQGRDAAQYTTDQLAALGRQLQESGIAPTFKGVQQIQSAVEQGADFVRDRRNQRNLPSVADEQGDVLSQVLSGAAQATGDRMPNIVEGMAEVGRNMPRANLGREPRGEGIERAVGAIARAPGALYEGIAELAPERSSETQRGNYPEFSGYKDRPAVDLAAAYGQAADETRAISVDEPEGLLGLLGRFFRPSSAQRAANRARDAELQRQRNILDEPGLADRFVDYATRPLDELDYYDPNAPKQTDEEVAQEIIATAPPEVSAPDAPAAPTAPAGRTLSREEIDAGSALAREAEMGGPEAAGRGASYLATRGGETALVDLANTVAQDATPENMNRFESEIQRLMERRESPIRALSSFLTAFSQARGGSMGQNLAIATTAMRATDDALDKQIIELEKLRRADQISERDFSLKQDQLEAQKGLLQAQSNYYANYRDMQEEIARIRAQEGVDAANRRLLQGIMETAGQNEYFYRMAAQKELDIDDMTSPEVARRAEQLKQQSIRDAYNEAQRYFRLSEGTGAGSSSLGTDIRSELEAYVGQQ